MIKITNKIKESFSKGFWTGTGFAVAVLATSLIAVAVTIPKTWKSGDVLTSADMNANFSALKTAVESQSQIVVVPNNSISSYYSSPLYAGFSTVLAATAENNMQYTFNRPSVVKMLRATVSYVSLSPNAPNMDTIITVRKNGVDTLLTLTIPSTAVVGNIFTSPVGTIATFNASDLFSIGQTFSVTPSSSSIMESFTLDYEVQ